jgi:hypothetical protein
MEKCKKCGCPRTIGADHDCIVALAARTEALRQRLERARGVSESDSWLAERGLGTYGPRTTGRTLQDRKTRPIQREYYEAVVEAGRCLCCTGRLIFRRNPRGGSYYACVSGHDCYYLGLDSSTGAGYELIATMASAVAQRKVG